jgi:hypothetical protein
LTSSTRTFSGSFQAPDHDYPAHLTLRLTVTDSRGLSSSRAIVLTPATVELRIESYPPGVSISAGVEDGVAPYGLRALAAGQITLAAPPTATIDGVEERFLRWSNGGARVQTVTASNRTYTAFYREPPLVEPPPPPSPPAAKPRSRWRAKPPKWTTSATARFAFSAKPAGSRLRCKLDAKPWRGCRSPRVYRGLKPGRHTLRLRAIGPDGSVERTPKVYRWRVERCRRYSATTSWCQAGSRGRS